ncbi:MAG: ATP-binding protein [Lachnospiraceae bacterium]|nr:ATP-binding protein [Lachnospiraceae bacterium]
MRNFFTSEKEYQRMRALEILLIMILLLNNFIFDGTVKGVVNVAVFILFIILLYIHGKKFLDIKEHNAHLNEQNIDLSNQVNNLSDQSARMELMLSMTPGLMVENLDDSNQVRIEGNITARFGLVSGLMEKEKFLKLIHPSDFIQYVLNYGKMGDGTYTDSDEVRVEIRLLTDEGNYIWTDCLFSALTTSEGIKRIVCTFNDIDAQKQKIKEHGNIIQSLSNQYTTLIIVDLIKNTYDVIKDERGFERRIPEKGKYTRLNRIFFGTRVPADDRIALTEQLTLDNIVAHLSPITPVMEIEYRRNLEKRLEERWERLTIVLVAEEDDKATMAMLCINDISEQKRQEIRNRQIIQEAMMAANQANNAKSDFLSRMSHDIRTPLNAIIGMSGIANKNINDSLRLKDCLKKIDNAGKHLLALVNEILDMSRIESGRFTIITEEINLADLIRNIYSIVENLAEQRNHKLKFITDDLLHLRIFGDHSRIQQILMNLLSNAVKYTPNGGEIVFTAIEEPGENEVSIYKFIVEDNGIGMSPEYITELYEPFTRVDDSRTSKIEGTGLGMAIVKNLVLLMNGDIEVESEVSRGTKFTVTLPLLHTKRIDDVKIKEVGNNTDFSGKRILMVEDNELNMEIAVDLLEMTGVTVEAAENGLIAVNMVKDHVENYYDLIFMDVQMPIMNGYEATKAIRGLGRRDTLRLPIIAITANAFTEDIERTKEAGMNDHVAKPINFAQILAVMNTYIV